MDVWSFKDILGSGQKLEAVRCRKAQSILGSSFYIDLDPNIHVIVFHELSGVKFPSQIISNHTQSSALTRTLPGSNNSSKVDKRTYTSAHIPFHFSPTCINTYQMSHFDNTTMSLLTTLTNTTNSTNPPEFGTCLCSDKTYTTTVIVMVIVSSSWLNSCLENAVDKHQWSQSCQAWGVQGVDWGEDEAIEYSWWCLMLKMLLNGFAAEEWKFWELGFDHHKPRSWIWSFWMYQMMGAMTKFGV